MIYALYAVTGLLILIQGGFFIQTVIISDVLLLAGIIFDIVRKKSRKRMQKASKLPVLLLASLFLCYVISSIYHHTEESALQRCLYLFMMMLLYFAVHSIPCENREKLLRCVVYMGVCESIIGIVSYMGMPVLFQDIIVNERFMGTFQYANASALFLGISLIVQKAAAVSGRNYAVKCRFPIMVMMVLTFSAGAVFCYVIACILLYLLSDRNRLLPLLYDLLELCLAGVFAIGIHQSRFYLHSSGAVIILMGITVLLGYNYDRYIKRMTSKMLIVITSVLGLMAVAAAVILFGKRVGGTGMERLWQMRDGIIAVWHNPLAGLGTGRWKDYIAMREEIQYESALVHNSYIQVGIESGVIAILTFVVFLYCLWRSLGAKGNVAGDRVVLLMVSVHWFFDITFFFGGIIACFMICAVSQGDMYRKGA